MKGPPWTNEYTREYTEFYSLGKVGEETLKILATQQWHFPWQKMRKGFAPIWIFFSEGIYDFAAQLLCALEKWRMRIRTHDELFKVGICFPEKPLNTYVLKVVRLSEEKLKVWRRSKGNNKFIVRTCLTKKGY